MIGKKMIESIRQLEAAGLSVKKQSHWWFVVDPRPGKGNARRLAAWDALSVFALLFTAFSSPFEVAFLITAEVDGLFVVNRLVDLIFFVDMVLQFFLMYEGPNGWVQNPSAIVRHYLAGWFTFDLFSVLAAGPEIWTAVTAQGGEKSDLGRIELLRMLRVLRLVKLARLARASKVLTRWQGKLNLDYAAVALLRCTVGICTVVHWSACAWALQVAFCVLPLSQTWMAENGYCVPAILATNVEIHPDVLDDPEYVEAIKWHEKHMRGHDLTLWAKGTTTQYAEDVDHICVPPSSMYVAACYWAVMTITSIGYGDLAPTARNALEQLVAAALMLIGGLMWGYVIATFAGLLATMSPTITEYRVTLDHLNHFMARHALTADLQQRLRDYFARIAHLQVAKADMMLYSKMPATLLGELHSTVHAEWLVRVPYLREDESRPPLFVVDLVHSLRAKVFPPNDIVSFAPRLYLVHRGLAVYGGSNVTTGNVWGEDCVLSAPYLRSRNTARAIGFLETFSISREPLLEIVRAHPVRA